MRTGLQWKVILTIVAVGLFPLAVGLAWTGLYGKSILVKASGEKFTELAQLMSNHVDFIIEREIHEAQSLALSEDLYRSVTLSNTLPTEQRDRPSISSQSLLKNEASKYLQAYQYLKEDEYRVIFATDRYGRVVASTRLLEEKNHARESWWQAAYHDGQGAVFISDLYSSPDSDSLQIDLAFPIPDRETRRTIGVLKFIIRDLELEEILKEVKIGTTGHAMLLSQDGRVLICPILSPSAHQPAQISINPGPQASWSLKENGHENKPTVVAFSLVSLTMKLGQHDSGIKPWWVAITQDHAELFAPMNRALWITMSLGGILAGLLVLLGAVAGRRLVQPILTVQQGAQALAQGDLGHRLHLKTHDELEALATTINHMAENLQQRTSELLAARDYLSNIIEQSAALIITTDPSFGIREFNRAAQETLLYRRDQVLFRNLDLLWDDPEEFRQIIPQLMASGQRINYETTLARKDGTSVPVVLSIKQLTDQGGNLLGLVVVGEDITDRKELEQARLEAERLMALHRLSTVLTHDLRSPMVGILKALAVLQETYGKMSKDQAQQLLSDLVRGGDLLLGTLTDLLDVYRHSLSALPLRYTDFVLREAIEEIIRLISIDAQTRNVKLEVKMALPELTISADRRRIQRVIFNLLDNAIKHSSSGGLVALHAASPEEGLIHLQVKDQGAGIPERECPRIFDFLYKSPDNPADDIERGGIGVGLYFCRVTVEAHGGRIWAENQPEGGACFTVSFPTTGRRRDQDGPSS
jgi:PAS domain S-box-containing protein